MASTASSYFTELSVLFILFQYTVLLVADKQYLPLKCIHSNNVSRIDGYSGYMRSLVGLSVPTDVPCDDVIGH